MTSLARRLGRDTVVYGLSTALSRAAGLLMLPIYTRYLSPANYGLLQLLDLAAEVTQILFLAGTRAGMVRFFFRSAELSHRRTVVSSTFALEVVLALTGALVLAAAAHPVWRLALAGEGTVGLVRLTALNFFLVTLQNTPLGYMQTAQRARTHATAQFIKLVLQVGFNLFFLVHLKMGVTGMLLSSVVVNAMVGVGLVAWMLKDIGWSPQMKVAVALRRYGFPYQLTFAGAFILTFGDRFFLQRYTGSTAVGLYALAYQFGFLLAQLSSGPFMSAWTPERFKGIAKSPDEVRRDTQQGFLFLNLLMFTIAVGIAVYARPALAILTDVAYREAANIIPLVLAAYVIQAWAEAVKFGIDAAEQPIYYTYASWSATAIVLVAYALLIPPLGPYGAALATVLAFAVRFGLTYFWSQRLWRLDYGWGRVRLLAAIATGLVVLVLTLDAASFAGQVAVGSAAMATYVGLVWTTVLPSTDRQALLTHGRRAIARLSGGAAHPE